MNKLWRRNQYRDPLTRELLGIEILPVDDLRPHTHSPQCDCIPLSRINAERVPVLEHASFDGREWDEPNCRHRAH